MLAQLVKAAALLSGLIVLSRLVSPAEFGFVAVPVAVVGVGEIIRDLGISTATTTARELSASTRDFLLWVNVSIGLGLALLMISIGISVGVVLGQTAYIPVSIALASIFVVNGWGAQYRAGLTRDLRFRALALADAGGALVGIAVAIAFAAFGAGYWAIIIQQVGVAVVTVLALVIQGRWLPGRARKTAEVGPIIRFGLSVSWSQVLLYLGNNIDTFALGVTASTTQLGYYTRSYQIAVQPFALIKAPMTSVALPLLSRRRDDAEGFRRAVLAGQSLISYTVVPLAVLMSVCADPIVTVFLGEQWRPAIPIVSVLALAGAVQQLVSVSSWMFMSRNLGGALAGFTTVSVVIKATLVLAAAPHGPTAVAWAFLSAMILTGPVAILWACRATGVSVGAVLLRMLQPVIVAFTAAALTWSALHLVSASSAVLQLLVGVVVFALIYIGAAVLPGIRRSYLEIVGLVRPQKRK